jgi:predicted ribonuclease toxin of YeeF-YezG toxin-antitoxin module
MSNGIVEALDQTVARLSKALGEDTSKAVEKLYRTTTGRLKKNIEQTLETDTDKAAEIKKILADMDENAGKSVASDAERKAQADAQAALRQKLKEALDPKYTYRRPTGWRSGMRETVWDEAKQDDGTVYDPLTGKEMQSDEPWDMGHKPGLEYHKHRDSAYQRGIPREQFLDEYYDTSHYRPELPESNQGHSGEDSSSYFGGP